MTDDLLEDYAKAYTGQLGFGEHPALIAVDMVQAYVEPESPLYAEVEDELAATIRIIGAARAATIPVFHTNVVYHESGRNGGKCWRKAPPSKCFVAGSPLGQWPGIAPRDDEMVISKQYPSAFVGTSLAAMLTSGGIDTLIITGVTTSGCIRATCVDAVSHGFIPIAVADTCGDRHQAPYEANLFDMNAKYGDVVSAQDVISHLANRA